MKALTFSQPYASLIADGEKFVENRSWSTNYRGPLAIHAGLGTQYVTKSQLLTFPHGCILAVAKLSACVRLSDLEIEGQSQTMILGTDIAIAEFLNHEHTEGPWCWILTDVRKVGPYPCRGKQGLWDWERRGVVATGA